MKYLYPIIVVIIIIVAIVFAYFSRTPKVEAPKEIPKVETPEFHYTPVPCLNGEGVETPCKG